MTLLKRFVLFTCPFLKSADELGATTQNNELWQARAEAHIKIVQEAWEALAWPQDDFNEQSFRSFGTYPGLAMLCYQLDKIEPGKSKGLRKYLLDIPGVRDEESLFEVANNDILKAAEQLDLLMPQCIRIFRNN